MNELVGIPTHPLFAHAAVTLVPLSALVLLISLFWGRARTRIGGVAPLLAVIAALAVWLTRMAGEYLEKDLGLEGDARVGEHSTFADALMIWAVVLAVVAIVFYVVTAERTRPVRERIPVLGGRAVRVVVGVLVVFSVISAVWGVVATGHSGAALVWGS